jgi:hypothetical protein
MAADGPAVAARRGNWPVGAVLSTERNWDAPRLSTGRRRDLEKILPGRATSVRRRRARGLELVGHASR